MNGGSLVTYLLIGGVIAEVFKSPQINRVMGSTNILAFWRVLLVEWIGYPMVVD